MLTGHSPTLLMYIARFIAHQTWISRGRGRVVNLIYNSKVPRTGEFQIDFFDDVYSGSFSEYLDCQVWLYGAYERHLLKFLRQAGALMLAERGHLIFCDVGANVGHHTLFMAKHASRVFAFEPYTKLHSKIREKITTNNLQNVNIIPVGLGEETCELSYFPGAGSNSGAGSFLRDTPEASLEGIPLPIMTGDEAFTKYSVPPVDLIKVDIEGFEAAAFRGLSKRLAADRPIILTEFGVRSRRLLAGEAEFRNLFYSKACFYRVDTDRRRDSWRLQPFKFEMPGEITIAVIPEEINAKLVALSR